MLQVQEFQTITISVDYCDTVNYANIHNGDNVCALLKIKNTGAKRLNNITVAVEGYYFPKSKYTINLLEPGKEKVLDASQISPSIDRLLALSEAVYTELGISVRTNSREIAMLRLPLTIQAWNHFRWDIDKYQNVTSFVMPHHSYVSEIVSNANKILKCKNPEYAMVGYTEDPDLFKAQLESVWEALSAENIKYLTGVFAPNADGQRIMTPDLIRHFRQGNCLDMTLLMCACLERINMSPVMVIINGHVMPGVWLNNYRYSSKPIITDPNKLSKIILKDTGIYTFESTMMAGDCSLYEACCTARNNIKASSPQMFIDISAARAANINPLPLANSPADLPPIESFDVRGFLTPADATRLEAWERKLLDLSLRNSMLNVRISRNISAIKEKNPENIITLLKEEILDAVVGEKGGESPEEILKYLHRAARTSLEETGTNSLFVTIGALEWYDMSDNKPHIAPLLFIPVQIVKKTALSYTVRLRDDDTMINVTLIEMLRQMFGLSMPELDNIPEDDNGFHDWKKLFDIFESHVAEINKHTHAWNRWVVKKISFIGLFSFTKYLMWSDIHNHRAVIDRHPLLHAMMENKYDGRPVEVSPAAIEAEAMSTLMLPVEYDSSQLEAISECHNGKTFVLHGPPGTGKSQTITNIIADMIYSGRRVLFVAEKKAALEVVRTRLENIGLGPYCLELHGTKTNKKDFFAQFDAARALFEKSPDTLMANDPEGQRYADNLRYIQGVLSSIIDAIHAERQHDMSLYDIICRYIANKYEGLAFSYENMGGFAPSDITTLCDEIASLDVVTRLLGKHPSESGLFGLYPTQNTVENQKRITEIIPALPQAIANARKKATGLLNRWFRKKSVEEILHSSPLWKEFDSLALAPDARTCSAEELEKTIERWKSSLSELRRWYQFSEKYHTIDSYNEPGIMAHYLNGHSAEETAKSTVSAYYHTLANNALDTDSRLRSFHGTLHEEKVKQYTLAADAFMKWQQKELLNGMRRHIHSLNLSDEEKNQFATLARRSISNGRAVSLRKIIAEADLVIGKIFPCMLMSPLSVAQYLELKSGLFDLVIFDEASQMETPDAVGAIARGGATIVVGDPRQLPPTRFFQSRGYALDDYDEKSDADSILEDCIALGLPSHYLSRHYRSRHESLIAFSNSAFYNNRLLTFPSNNDAEQKVSVIDPEGIYDVGRSRTNAIEAEAVVDYVINRVESTDADELPSIGIIAFSKMQSNLIEDILNDKLQRKKDVRMKLDSCEEPLFVKNLENVQGDERDLIIFSIGYGPDKNGNVLLNFGPLNMSGGERRLNVAVSRAREEMVVFSSLKPHHIPTEGKWSAGVKALRGFLDFAQSGILPQQQQNDDVSKDSVVEDIASGLRRRGLEVKTNVGRSSFKIDIAIADPENPAVYKKGLILDGRNYRSLPTVRDREVTIPAVLNRLGWEIQRIWVVDWIENPEQVLDSICGDAV